MELLIERFWKCCIDGTCVNYPFEEFFSRFEGLLYSKLSRHGLTTFEDYISELKSYYDFDILERYVYKSVHSNIEFTLKDIIELIFRPRFLTYRDKYSKDETYHRLLLLYSEVSARYTNRLSLTGKILLVDKCLNAEHNTGHIINVDIDRLRKDFEAKLEEECKFKVDRAFGIYTRNALEEKVSNIEAKDKGKRLYVAFLDFVGIGNMNKREGYNMVNRRINSMFSSFKFREGDIVARYFSGDEIVIISQSNSFGLMRRLREYAGSFGLKFRYVITPWRVGVMEFDRVMSTSMKAIEAYQ